MSCSGLTRRGRPCGNRTRPGRDRCYVHASSADVLEGKLLGVVEAAAPEEWRAATWLLERLWPAKYARPAQRTGEVRGPPPEPVVKADGLDELAGRRSARRAT